MALMPPQLPMMLGGEVAGLGDDVTVLGGGQLIAEITLLPALIGRVTMPDYLWIGSDVDVVIGASSDTGLRRSFDGSYINNATITAQLRDDTETAVGSSVTVDYVSSSDGRYHGVFDSTVTALCNRFGAYYVDISIDAGEYEDFRRIPMQARYHDDLP